MFGRGGGGAVRRFIKGKGKNDRIDMSLGKRAAVVTAIAGACGLFYLYLVREKEIGELTPNIIIHSL